MIAIVDYGAGNIFSVKNALDFLGLESQLTDDAAAIQAAEALRSSCRGLEHFQVQCRC